MALKIRLTRIGSRHRPFFRLVVVDSRARRDGRSVSILGYYNPLAQPHQLKIHQEAVLDWLNKGAQPTETVRSLLKQTGVWQRYQLLKEGKPAEEVEQQVATTLEKMKVRIEEDVVRAAAKKAARTTLPTPSEVTSTDDAAPEAPSA